MEVVGVEAAVEGLSSFSSDIGKMNGLLDSLRPKASLLTNAFDSISESLGRFAASVVHVVEYALGKLLADAVEFIIGKLRDLASEALEAGAAFQILSLRLQGMNMQTAIDSGLDYTAAMKLAEEQTKADLTWVMKLAAVTPFDATDIANVFTLARSYGFASDEAKRMTESTMNFAAGMGLGSEALERIIVNFGQMIQRGKITTREMNDLARGSMLPLADVLKRVATNMGITVEDLTKLIQTSDGVPAEQFIKAFEEMTESEVRFNGASERMARTLKGASENITQTIRDLLGFYVIKPVFDVIGARLAAIMDAIVDPKRWARLTETLGGIGSVLGNIVTAVFGLVPSADTLADNLISGLEGLRTWLEEHESGIMEFFSHLRDIIQQIFPNLQLGAVQNPYRAPPSQATGIHQEPPKVIPFGAGAIDNLQKVADFITKTLIPAWDEFKKWIADNKPMIDEFFTTLGDIVSTIFEGLFGGLLAGGKGKGEETVLGVLKSFMQWVIDNKDEIAKWGEIMLKVIGAFIVFSAVNTLIWTLLLDVFGLILGSPIDVIIALVSLFEAMGFVSSGGAASPWTQVANFFKMLPELASGITDNAFKAADIWIKSFCQKISEKVTEIKTTIIDTVKNLTGIDLAGENIGKQLMNGMAIGIEKGTSILMDAVTALARRIISTLLNIFDEHSPSRVTEKMGENLVAGLAQGMNNFSGMVTEAMAGVVMPALEMPRMAGSYTPAQAVSNTSYSTSNAFNLNIHTNARAEPIIADFGMMQSLMGG